MAIRPLSFRTKQAARQLGEQVLTWRKLRRLTAEQLSERAGTTRGTLRRLEHGDPSVGLDTFLSIVHALGQLDRLVTALDPYETDLGRARADEALPVRVRR